MYSSACEPQERQFLLRQLLCNGGHFHFSFEAYMAAWFRGLVWSRGFCFSSQALDVILEKMKASGFDFSQVLALSGAGQVCLQWPPSTTGGRISWAVVPVARGDGSPRGKVLVLETHCTHFVNSKNP